MANNVTRLTDVIVPEVYEKYVNANIISNFKLIESGAITHDASLASLLAGGGASFTIPLWTDCTNVKDNIGSDDPSEKVGTDKLTATSIVIPRMVRTHAWTTANITQVLSGADPMAEIGRQDIIFRRKSLQNQFLAVVKGIFANNATENDGIHVKGDMRFDVSSTEFVEGVTNITAGAIIDAVSTMGDTQDDLGTMIVHSKVYARMKKDQLIQTIQPAVVGARPIEMYGNYRLLVSDVLPYDKTTGICSTYIFGSDQFKLAFGQFPNAISADVDEAGGNGTGITTLYSRWVNAIAPNGFSFVGTIGNKSPSNDATSNNLASASSWKQVIDRKAIKMVELVTREHAATSD